MMKAGMKMSVSSQAMTTPMATKRPKTWTGGIGAMASEPKATAVVKEV